VGTFWTCYCSKTEGMKISSREQENKMEIATRLSNEIARYLDLDTRQIQLTAANMANIDTPGYRAVGMDFEAEMRQAMTGADEDDVLVAPQVFQVDGLIVRPDGNNVSMDRESLNLAQAQLKFKVGVALLKNQYSEIMNAIHADAK
jgi:flagellar basal-body rod protein FlgB